MKLLIVAFVTLGFQAWAGVADIENADIVISPARIEQALVFRDGPFAISLTRVDNGGSTDSYPISNPSTLVLGIFLQGQMFDVALAFELYNNVALIDSASVDAANHTLHAVVQLVDENTFNMYPMNLTVHLTDAMIAAVAATDETYDTLKTTVGLQAWRP